MKRFVVLFVSLALTAGCAANNGNDQGRKAERPARRMAISSEDGYRIARNFEAVSTFRNWADGKTKFAVGTRAGFLHIMSFDAGGLNLEWQSPHLGAPVRGVLVRDFQGVGRTEIMVYTAGGRLFMMDMQDYSVARENAAFDMPEIEYAIAMQLDKDPALELLACGGGRFAVYDAATMFKEWEAPGDVPGEWMAVGDIDGDGNLEVVLNSGYVLDARFFRIEYKLGNLGERIEIMDIDGDGVEEILAENQDGEVSVYDARMPGTPEY